ncbi:AGC/Akt protein kinase [Collybia nuda]|uniref:non-specific serine/threonine protein kinase n=1 Tax=Collybia nuda TaxID=64659 RepID=A0A9P6CNQ3_9AGAR|nr:AGC/Akt protein kinase [Collybia nuda]
MSSWLNRSKKSSVTNLRSNDFATTRSTTPTPGNPDGIPSTRSGVLAIRVLWAEGLSVPPGTVLPTAVQHALTSQQAQVAASVSPSSVTQQRLAKTKGNRDSVQRTQCWWLPYLVMEYEVNQVLITPLGGDIEKPLYMYQAHFDVSRNSEISLQCYLRAEEPKRGGDGLADDLGNDIFLGGIKFVPDFDDMGSQDQWYEVVGGTGKVQIGVSYQPSYGQSLTIDDFELITVIGKGSFGKVMQVRKRDTSRIYALKTIRKMHIVNRNEITHTLAERLVLAQVNSPFIVPLKFSFQSEQKLYLVLAFVNGGELFHHLQREHQFNEERSSRFYSAELLLALEHLHELDVVYRDLKPENILLDYTGHIALCDFGLCKLNMKGNEKTNTFCGTPEYLAPEILNGEGYDKTIDWWTLGVLLYEMLSGLPPFYDEVTDEMYKKILNEPLVFGPDIGSEARSILTGLLTRDPTKRLGVNGAEEIKKHPFFGKHIDFKKLLQKKIHPPFKPSVASPVDVSNFDTVFTTEAPIDSFVEDSNLSQTVQAQFSGFSYNGTNLPN